MSGTFKHKRGSPRSERLSIHAQAMQQGEQPRVYFGRREGKRTTPRGYSELSGHTCQTSSRLLKKAHFRVINWEPGVSGSRYFSPFHSDSSWRGTRPHVAHYFWEVLKQSWCKTGKNKSGEIYAALDQERNWEQGLVGLR